MPTKDQKAIVHQSLKWPIYAWMPEPLDWKLTVPISLSTSKSLKLLLFISFQMEYYMQRENLNNVASHHLKFWNFRWHRTKSQPKMDNTKKKKKTKMLSGLGERLEENSALRLIHRLEKRTINPFKTKSEPCGYNVLIYTCLILLKHKKIPKHDTYQTTITNWSSEKPNDL